MRIAFVSYECPPDTALGGIATYIGHAAPMLARAGHSVEVFAASPDRKGTFTENGVVVHRVRESDRERFAGVIAPVFAARHRAEAFDVLEAPEYFADARAILELVPDIPLLLRLHTPSYQLWRMELEGQYGEQLRHILGALRRRIKHGGAPKSGFEYNHAIQADVWASPSKSLADILTRDWELPKERVCRLPYPFVPDPELLEIPIETETGRILYVGRLETRKGVLQLAAAIPRVLHQMPEIRFRFVGRSVPYRKGVEMVDELKSRLHRFRREVEFVGGVPYSELPTQFAECDLCVFPSYWDNFPYVCLEAMAAGRGIVASREGGMAEMLQRNAGETATPDNPVALASAIWEMMTDTEFRHTCARNARERILTEYAPERIAPMQIRAYEQAIAHRRSAGSRRNLLS